jgi:hypothetical protein
MSKNEQIIKAFEELLSEAVELISLISGLESRQASGQLQEAKTYLEGSVNYYNQNKELIIAKLEENILTLDDLEKVKKEFLDIKNMKISVSNLLDEKKVAIDQEIRTYHTEITNVEKYYNDLKKFQEVLSTIHALNEANGIFHELQDFLKEKDEVREFITQFSAFKKLIININEHLVDAAEQQMETQKKIQDSLKRIDRQIFHKHSGGNPEITEILNKLKGEYDQFSNRVKSARNIDRLEDRNEYTQVIMPAKSYLDTINGKSLKSYSNLKGNAAEILDTSSKKTEAQKMNSFNSFKGNLKLLIEELDSLIRSFFHVIASLSRIKDNSIPGEIQEYVIIFQEVDSCIRIVEQLEHHLGTN